jgi:hypothetical protein
MFEVTCNHSDDSRNVQYVRQWNLTPSGSYRVLWIHTKTNKEALKPIFKETKINNMKWLARGHSMYTTGIMTNIQFGVVKGILQRVLGHGFQPLQIIRHHEGMHSIWLHMPPRVRCIVKIHGWDITMAANSFHL